MRGSGCKGGPGRLARGALLAAFGLLAACASPAEPGSSWKARTASAELSRALDAESRGQREQALELGRRALQHAREAAALGTVGRALLLVGRMEADLAPCLEAVAVFEHSGDPAGRAEAQVVTAGVLLELGLPDESLLRLHAAAAALEAADLGRQQEARLSAPLHHTAAEALRALGRDAEAPARERQADLALSLLGDEELPALRTQVELGLGADDRLLGWPARSVEHFSRALDLARGTGDREAQLDALTGIVDALTDLRRFSDAISHCERALDLARQTGDAARVQGLGRRGVALLAELGDNGSSERRRSFEEALLAGR